MCSIINKIPISVIVRTAQCLMKDPELSDEERKDVVRVQQDIHERPIITTGEDKQAFILRLVQIVGADKTATCFNENSRSIFSQLTTTDLARLSRDRPSVAVGRPSP